MLDGLQFESDDTNYTCNIILWLITIHVYVVPCM